MNGTSSKPLVSVIIPTFNRAAFVRVAVESVLRQSYRPLEIIVVDDGSRDDTQDVLTPLVESVRYTYQENQGVAVARNAGIAASKGEYVSLLDSDDVWLPDKLTCQMDYLLTHPEVGMVACHAVAIDTNGDQLDGAPICAHQCEGWVSQETNILRSPLILSTLLVRRACLPTPDPFPPGVCFGEDWEMGLRVGASYPIWFLDQVLVKVRRHEGNATAPLASQLQADRKLQDRLAVIDRIFPLLPGSADSLRSLRAQAEAQEYAAAAVPSYANEAFELAASRLGKAVALDPATWQGEELVTRVCGFAQLVYQERGEEAAFSFLDNVIGHLPPEIGEPVRVARALRARTLIFTVGFNALADSRPRKAASSIMRGLMQQPSYARNSGVLITLARSMARSLQLP